MGRRTRSVDSPIDLGKKPGGPDRPPVRPAGETGQGAPQAPGAGPAPLGIGQPAGSNGGGNGHAPGGAGDPGRPGRGRPPKPKSEAPADLVKGFPKPPPVQRLTEKEREQKAAEAGKTLLTFASGAASTLLGPEAKMSKLEEMAIEGPLSRLLERLPPTILENVSEWTDPLALCLALFFW